MQARGSLDLPPDQLLVGPPHAAFINAAFSYWRPRELNRFNGPGRGAWYAALDIQTCIAEVTFHITRELGRVNDFNAAIEYTEMFASFAGEFVDMRSVTPRPDCLHPDPAVSYPAGNAVADLARIRGYNGIVYPSVRHEGGTCLVAIWPSAVQSVAQGRVLRVLWTGKPMPKWSFFS